MECKRKQLVLQTQLTDYLENQTQFVELQPSKNVECTVSWVQDAKNFYYQTNENLYMLETMGIE